MSALSHKVLIQCRVLLRGPGPTESIVAIALADGTDDELVVPDACMFDGRVSVLAVASDEDTTEVIYYPSDSTRGNSRGRVRTSDTERRMTRDARNGTES
jgi:hypothetical protein